MPFKGIHRVVGRADEGDIRLLDDAADGKIRVVAELIATQIPDLLGGVQAQMSLIAEEAAQLQIAPMVHGIADSQLQRLHKLQKTLVIVLLAGDIVLADAVGAHDAPFIMVAEIGAVRLLSAQPHLGQVVKAPILIDLPRRDMAVIVDNGQFRRIVVIEMLGGFALEQKVLIHKLFHVGSPRALRRVLLSENRFEVPCKNEKARPAAVSFTKRGKTASSLESGLVFPAAHPPFPLQGETGQGCKTDALSVLPASLYQRDFTITRRRGGISKRHQSKTAEPEFLDVFSINDCRNHRFLRCAFRRR